MAHQLDSLDGMTPEQVAQAYRQGRLDAMLGRNPEDVAVLDRAHTGAPLTRDDLATLARLGKDDLIREAVNAGRIAGQ